MDCLRFGDEALLRSRSKLFTLGFRGGKIILSYSEDSEAESVYSTEPRVNFYSACLRIPV